MKRLKTIFACMLMALFSIGQVLAAEDDTHDFEQNISQSMNNCATFSDIVIAEQSYSVKSVVITYAYNKTIKPQATVTIGETEVGTQDFVSTRNLTTFSTLTFTPDSPIKGAVTITNTAGSSCSGSSKGTLKVTNVQLVEGPAGGGSDKCSTPSISPAACSFYGSQQVTITSATEDAVIYYTIDESIPSSSNGTLYPGSAITVSGATTTVKAIAIKEGLDDSDVASVTYTYAGAAVSGYAIDFESDLVAYVDWEFTNLALRTYSNNSVTPHSGTYYAANATSSSATSGTASAIITTKDKVAKPGVLTFYISKESNNTSASSWVAQVSEDGDTWTDVETFDAKIMSKGSWNECVADLSEYTNVYVRISYGSSTALRAIDDINLEMASAVNKPIISGDDNFYPTTTVTLTQAAADAIYYTTNGDAPTTGSTLYEGPFELNATATVKAIAIKDEVASAVAEKTFTKATILTVAEALTIIEGLNNKTATTAEYYVSGVVSTVTVLTVDGTGEYYISADGTKTSELQVYKGKWVGGANFTSTDQLIEGDDVTIKGKLKKYNDYKELDQNNEVVLYKLKARLAWSEESYEADLSSSNTYPSLTNTNGVSVSYSSSNTDAATINPSTGAISLVAVGSTTIKATFTGNETYKANEVSYTLNVSNSVLRADISFEENGGSTVTDLTEQSNLPDPLPTITKAGYNFGGWWTTSDFQAGTEAVAGAAVESTDDIVLYAKWLDSYTVTEALTMIDALADNGETGNVYVSGIVCTAPSNLISGGYLTYYISVDGTETNRLQVYKGKNVGNIAFTDKEDVQAADQVIVYGPLKKFKQGENIIPEFNTGNYLYSLSRKASAGLEYAVTVVAKVVGDDDFINPLTNPNSVDVTYESSDEQVAEVASDGTVTIIGEGSATITASFAGNATYKTAEVSYTLTVSATAPVVDTRKIAASPEGGFSSINGDLSGNEISFAAYKGGAQNEPNGNNTAHELRLYKYQATTEYGGYVTISAKTGCTIDQVVITVSGDCNVGWCKDAEALPTKEDTPIAIGTSSAFDTGTGLDASSVSVVNIDEANQFKIKTITVYYTGDAITLQSIAISGEASVLEYNDGDEFIPTGLVVTGHYSDNSDAVIADGITWAFDPATLSEGDESVSVTATVGNISSSAFPVNGLTVSGAAPALTDYYEKVTETAGIVEGTYLIVYEGESVAFDGGLDDSDNDHKLDKASNTIEVDITNDNKIGVTSATEAATFYIDPTAGTIQAASGKYIGVTSNNNGLNTNNNADAYSNAFSIDGDGNAIIAAVFDNSTMTMRYNTASDQKRFRYYKNTNYPAIQLYKLHDEVVKPAAGLAWDPAEDITITVGDAFTARTLLNPNNIDDAEITIASSNPALATVNAGVVSLVADATGTTTITATFAGNASYKPATVSYKIKVNPAHSIYVSPGLNVNFGSVEKNADVEDKVITVTLTEVPNATATIGGDNPEVFSINPASPAALTTSGDITISVASTATAGTYNATLTISDDAGLATSRVVALKLTVTDPAAEETPISTSTQWVAATAADLVDGAEVLITGVKSEVTYAMSASSNNGNNRTADAGSLAEGVFTPGGNTMSFILEATGVNNNFYIKTSNGMYIYNASTSGNSYLKTKDNNEDASWKIELNEGNAVITSVENTNRQLMRFNLNGQSSPLFNCYASNQQPIKLYVPKPAEPEPPVVDYTEVRNGLTEGWYYTMCLDKAVTAVQGGTIWRVLSKAENGTDVILEEAVLPLVAGRPYIFNATADKLEVVYNGAAVGAPVEDDNNGLVGSFTKELIAAGDKDDSNNTNNNYIIYNNELYFVNSDNVYVGANRAYLNMAAVPDYNNNEPQVGNVQGRRRVVMNVNNGNQMPTGIEGVEVSEAPRKVMINGQLFILRDKKMYDASGRLVK